MVNELTPFEWALLPLKKYARFQGRAPRAEYWWFTLATSVLRFGVDKIDKAAGDTGGISSVYSLVLLLPALAVGVRRLHDIDRTGAWLFTIVIPLVSAGALGVAAGMSGSSFPSAYLLVAGLGIIIAAIVLLVFMITPGTAGSNRYGPDPYGGHDDLEEVFA